MKSIIRRISVLLLLFSLAACAKSAEEQIEEQLRLGQRYLTEMNYEKAIVAFEKVIELEPKQMTAYLGIAKAHVALEEEEAAVVILERAWQVMQESYDRTQAEFWDGPAVLILLADLYEESEETGKAEEVRSYRESLWEKTDEEALDENAESSGRAEGAGDPEGSRAAEENRKKAPIAFTAEIESREQIGQGYFTTLTVTLENGTVFKKEYTTEAGGMGYYGTVYTGDLTGDDQEEIVVDLAWVGSTFGATDVVVYHVEETGLVELLYLDYSGLGQYDARFSACIGAGIQGDALRISGNLEDKWTTGDILLRWVDGSWIHEEAEGTDQQESEVELEQETINNLISLAGAVGDRILYAQEPVSANIEVSRMTPEEKAFLFYWYQYHYGGSWSLNPDTRIKTPEHLNVEYPMEYHSIMPSDIPDIMTELTGSCSALDLEAVKGYVAEEIGGEYLMWATGDFGDAGAAWLSPEHTSSVMERGRLRITGDIHRWDRGVEDYVPVGKFTAYFVPNPEALMGYQFSQLILSEESGPA